MKKVIFVIPITILFILLSSNHKAQASVQYPDGAYIIMGGAGGAYKGFNIADTTMYYRLDGVLIIYSTTGAIYEYSFGTDPDVVPTTEQILNGTLSATYTNQVSRYYANNPDIHIYVVNGTLSGTGADVDNYPEPDPPTPPPEPTWFEIWYNRVHEFLEDWIPWAVDLDNTFDDIYLWMFGMELDGDDVFYGNDIEFSELPTPTPFPTQIPYQEHIVPDSNGGFTVQYVYLNPSGTPITATAPPPEPTYTIQITESPQYDISGVPVPPADGLQDAIDAIDDNIDDYQEGFEAVQGSFSVLPIKWFFFFGVPAAIILIGGIIRSLLGG